MYLCHVKISYGEINERSFSTPNQEHICNSRIHIFLQRDGLAFSTHKTYFRCSAQIILQFIEAIGKTYEIYKA